MLLPFLYQKCFKNEREIDSKKSRNYIRYDTLIDLQKRVQVEEPMIFRPIHWMCLDFERSNV